MGSICGHEIYNAEGQGVKPTRTEVSYWTCANNCKAQTALKSDIKGFN